METSGRSDEIEFSDYENVMKFFTRSTPRCPLNLTTSDSTNRNAKMVSMPEGTLVSIATRTLFLSTRFEIQAVNFFFFQSFLGSMRHHYKVGLEDSHAMMLTERAVASSLLLGLDIVAWGCVSILFWLPLTWQRLLQGVPDAAHEYGAEQVLKRQEQVMDAQQKGWELEVNEENDHSKVDDRMRGINKSLPLQDEENGCSQAALCGATKKRVKYDLKVPKQKWIKMQF